MSYVYMPQVNQYDAFMQPFNPMLGEARDVRWFRALYWLRWPLWRCPVTR